MADEISVYIKKPIDKELEDVRKDIKVSREKIIEVAIDSFVHSYRSTPIKQFLRLASLSEKERKDAIKKTDKLVREISRSLVVSDPEAVLEDIRKAHWEQ